MARTCLPHRADMLCPGTTVFDETLIVLVVRVHPVADLSTEDKVLLRGTIQLIAEGPEEAVTVT